MKLKQLFTDDDAVSPVIGVILMVAITVILAAVIASFVLGLGQQTGNESPTASFGFDYEEGADSSVSGSLAGTVTITHQSGDTILARELFIKGDNIATGTTEGQWNNIVTATETGDTSEVSSGSRVVVDADRDYDVQVIWQPPERDTSNQLGSQEGPDA